MKIKDTDSQEASVRMLDAEIDEAILKATSDASWLSSKQVLDSVWKYARKNPDALSSFARRAVYERVRERLRSMTRDDGSRAFENVTIIEGENETRVYKQVDLFNMEDFEQAIRYHSGVAQHHLKRCAELRDEAKARGIQLHLRF